MYKQVYKLE